MKKLIALLLAALILFTGCDNSILDRFLNNDVQDNVVEDLNNNTNSDGNTDQKPNDQTPDDQKPDDQKPDDQKPDDQKPDDQKPDDQKPDDSLEFDEGPVITEDPYTNVNVTEFYKNYTPAVSASDAKFRSKHYLMSGSIAEQDQEPTIAQNRPMQDGKYLRNTSCFYSADKNTYFILDSEGKVVNKIFRGGAYVTLEEVAAYLLAFGEIPANYTSSKSGSPSNSPWGKYLRCNNSSFSGSTTRYPYEPELPRISGCGGDLYYYEIDIGTTGTDCDPSYSAAPYNNGNKIVRGAARIVYTRYDANRNSIIDPNEKVVFYTYNHYNDFQEYLNYYGGWGEMFGNITGGGTISSKYNYNPTPYVPVIRAEFRATSSAETAQIATYIVTLAYVDLSKLYAAA